MDFNPKISLFKNARTSVPYAGTPSVLTMLEFIKSGTYKIEVENVRNATNKADRDELKKQLKAVTWSAEFNNKRNADLSYVHQYSHLICHDIDKLELSQLSTIKTKLCTDKRVFACFVSPSGNGLKVLFRTDTEIQDFLTTWKAIANFIEKKIGVKVDDQCKDISRLCFVSYDPDLHLYEAAKPIDVDFIEKWLTVNDIVKIGVETLIETDGKPQESIKRTPKNDTAQKVFDLLDKCHNIVQKTTQAGPGNYNRYIGQFATQALRYDLSEDDVLTEMLSYCPGHDPKDTTACIRNHYKNKADEIGKYNTSDNSPNVVENQSEKTHVVQQSVLKEFATYNTTVKFWYMVARMDKEGTIIKDQQGHEVGEYKYSYDDAITFLQNNGFYKYKVGSGYQFIQVDKINKQVEIVDELRIKEFMIDFLKSNISNEYKRVREMFRRGAKNYCSTGILEGMDYFNPDLNRDTSTSAYIYFKNCFLDISKEGIVKKQYKDQKGYIWKRQMLDFEYSETDFTISDTNLFLWYAVTGRKCALNVRVKYNGDLITVTEKVNVSSSILAATYDQIINPETSTAFGSMGALKDFVQANFFDDAAAEALAAANSYTDEKTAAISAGTLPAITGTDPADHEGVFSFKATQTGTYTHFGGLVISAGDIPTGSQCFIESFDSGATWHKRTEAIADVSAFTPRGGSDKTMKQMDDEINQESFHADAYQYGVTVATPTLLTTANYCFCQKGYTVPADSHIDLVNVNASGIGTLYVIVNRLSAGLYSEVSRTSISVVSGNNAVAVNIPVLSGDKLGIGNSASIVAKYTNGGTKYAAVNITSTIATFTQAALEDAGGSNGIMGFNFHVAAVDITPGLREIVDDKADASALNALDAVVVKDSDLTIEAGSNKFDKATMVLSNKLVDNTGALITISGAKVFRIPYKPSTEYAFMLSRYPGTQGGQIRVVNNSLALLSTFDGASLNADGTGTGKVMTSPATSGYFEINGYYAPTSYADMTDTLMFCEGAYCLPYEGYEQSVTKINGVQVASASGAATVPYFDLNTCLFADSTGMLPEPNSWVKHFLERIRFRSFNNFSKSGATWSHTASTAYDITITGGAISDNNVIWNQFNILKDKVDNNLVEAPDLIIIPAGTNDNIRTIGNVATVFGVGTTIISNNPNTILSVADGVRFVVENILAEWPLVQVILATPFQRGISDNTTIRAIGDAIEGCAERLSLKVIRQDKIMGIYGFNEISADIFLYDNLHQNAQGAERIGKCMFREILNRINI